MASSVRVRFAPAPARAIDIDSAHTALSNWAFALRSRGRFILRIEDAITGHGHRSADPEPVEEIIRVLAALGIRGDEPAFEGPYFQSCNTAEHRKAAERLLDERCAYFCACDPGTPRCAASCHVRGLLAGQASTLRFRSPGGDGGDEPSAGDDGFPIASADGSPLFVLANTVDDITEGVTHVIRGEGHAVDTARQLLLWEALGAAPPTWVHLPPVSAEWRTGSPGRPVTVEDLVADGCLPLALADYLTCLRTAESRLDERQLGKFNRDRIRALSVDEFAGMCRPWLVPPHAPWPFPAFDEKRFAAVAPLVQSRITYLSEVTGHVDWLFLAEPLLEEKAWARVMRPGAADLLADIREALPATDWSAPRVATALSDVTHAHKFLPAAAESVVRVAVTGRAEGLPLAAALSVLGRRRTLVRIRTALRRLGSA